jgi:hypothetical protein
MHFYDQDWCKENFKSTNQAMVFKAWLNTEAKKLGPEQTLFVDSITGLQDAIHIYLDAQTPLSKDGQPDGFYLWKHKDNYLRDIHNFFKTLQCHVVVAMHSKEERDKGDCLIGKITPAMTGGFKEKLGSHYTDVFRAYTTPQTSTKPATYMWQVWADSNHDYVKARGSYSTQSIVAGFQNMSHK